MSEVDIGFELNCLHWLLKDERIDHDHSSSGDQMPWKQQDLRWIGESLGDQLSSSYVDQESLELQVFCASLMIWVDQARRVVRIRLLPPEGYR